LWKSYAILLKLKQIAEPDPLFPFSFSTFSALFLGRLYAGGLLYNLHYVLSAFPATMAMSGDSGEKVAPVTSE